MSKTSLPILGAIADDLTGGIELAGMLVRQGMRCAFVTNTESLSDLVNELDCLDAIIVALKIRIIPAKEAVAAAELAVKGLLTLGVRQIFYKYCATFDSTDKGNIGPIADYLADHLNAKPVLFCPSFPDVGVTVFAGHQFRFNSLMSNTTKRDDPVTPMTDPDLRAVLSRQSKNKVGVLELPHILKGIEVVKNALNALDDEGCRFVIADTVRNEDLPVLAEAGVDAPLLTGNSSIAEYLPTLWCAKGWRETKHRVIDLAAVEGPGIVLAGSCADRTLAQLGVFEAQAPVLRIDLTEPVEDIVLNALKWVQSQSGDVCAVATSSKPDAVRVLQEKFGVEGASARSDAIFAQLAPKLADAGIKRFLVAGGETSGTVVKALGLHRLEIGAYEGPGLGFARSVGDSPLALCLKSGKLGENDMFMHTLDRMAKGIKEDA